MGDQEDPKGKGKQKVPEYQEYQSTPATRAMATELVMRYSSGWNGNTSAASAGAPGAPRIPAEPTPENPEQDAPRAADQPHGHLTGMGQQAEGSSFHQGVDLHGLPWPHQLTLSDLPPLLCVRCHGPLEGCPCWNRNAQGVLHGPQQQQFGGNNPPLLPVAAGVQQFQNQLGEASRGPPAFQNLLPSQHGASGVRLLQNQPAVGNHPMGQHVEAPAVQLGHPSLQSPPQAQAAAAQPVPVPDYTIGQCWGCFDLPAEIRYQPCTHVCLCDNCRVKFCWFCNPGRQARLLEHGAGLPQLLNQPVVANNPVGQHGEAAPPVQLENPGLQAPPQAHPVLPAAGQPGPGPGLCSSCGLRPAEMLSQPQQHVCVCHFCRLAVVCKVCNPDQQQQLPAPQHSADVQQLQNQPAVGNNPVGQHGEAAPPARLENPGLQAPPQAHPVLPADQPDPAPDPQSDLCSSCGENPAWVRYQPRRHPCVCFVCRYLRRVVCQVCFYAYADDRFVILLSE